MVKITFESKRLILSDVPGDKKFIANNGSTFKNLEELESGLKKMNPDIFKAHVTNYKNDFSSWIYDCIGDFRLADDIRKITNQQEMLKKIKARIDYLKKNEKRGK